MQPALRDVPRGPTDKRIRGALVERLKASDPSARIVHELSLLRGERRADVAHINGLLCGYEIKSCRDSMFRLPGQIEAYAGVFEHMTAVVAPCHLKAVSKCVPPNWGIMVVQHLDEELVFEQVRKSRKNKRQEKSALVRLLWKEECLKILRSEGFPVNRAALVVDIWKDMETLPLGLICQKVKEALKIRCH
jgi:hypothetical protein